MARPKLLASVVFCIVDSEWTTCDCRSVSERPGPLYPDGNICMMRSDRPVPCFRHILAEKTGWWFQAVFPYVFPENDQEWSSIRRVCLETGSPYALSHFITSIFFLRAILGYTFTHFQTSNILCLNMAQPPTRVGRCLESKKNTTSHGPFSRWGVVAEFARSWGWVWSSSSSFLECDGNMRVSSSSWGYPSSWMVCSGESHL